MLSTIVPPRLVLRARTISRTFLRDRLFMPPRFLRLSLSLALARACCLLINRLLF